VAPLVTFHYLKEDGSGALLLENGAGYYTLETAPIAPALGAPQGFTVAVNGQSSVTLAWTAIASTLLAGYNVWRDGVLITPAPIAAATFIDSTVVANRHYNYAVAAVDVFGNVGPQTPTLRAEVLTNTTLGFQISWVEQPGMAGRPDTEWTWF
jgi:hypothetical protein